MEEEYIPIHRPESFDQGSDLGENIGTVRRALDIRRVGKVFQVLDIHGANATTALLPPNVSRGCVVGDSIYPSSQGTLAPEPGQAAPYGEMQLLQQVLLPKGLQLVRRSQTPQGWAEFLSDSCIERVLILWWLRYSVHGVR